VLKFPNKEVDVADGPEKLTEIGCNLRQELKPIQLPGSPTQLRAIAEGQGTLWLKWEKSANGGPVRNYIIIRRQMTEGGGPFGPWTLAHTTHNCGIPLTDLPADALLQYRVKAVNTDGESMPSNTISVILP
jgi:hypothetical protein